MQSTELLPDTALCFFPEFTKPWAYMIFSDTTLVQWITLQTFTLYLYSVLRMITTGDSVTRKFSQRKCCSLFQDPSFSTSPVTLARLAPQYRSARIWQNHHGLLWPTQFHLEKVLPHSGTKQRGGRKTQKSDFIALHGERVPSSNRNLTNGLTVHEVRVISNRRATRQLNPSQKNWQDFFL